MMKRLVCFAMLACAATASAMPTKKELAQAQKVVSEITASDMRDMKQKKKTPAEVAKNHMELAAKSDSEAGKFLLLQGAFKLYAKAGDYDGAATALETMNDEIKDMNPAVIVDIYNKAIYSSIKKKAPRLYIIKEVARKTSMNRSRLPKLEKTAKADPKEPTAQKMYAECLAELGEWDKALDAFILSGGKVAEMAKAEKESTAKPQDIAAFWWDYGRDTNAYRIHAAELYEYALDDVEFTGLQRELVEQRIAGLEKDAMASAEWKANSKKKAQEMVFDKPVTIKLNDTVSMEFVPVAAETFQMGNVKKGNHKAVITRPYWMGKAIVNRGMYRAFRPEHGKNDPNDKPTHWMQSYNSAVEFSAWLTQRFRMKLPRGYVFRLPTETEWELARSHKIIPDTWHALENTLDCSKSYGKGWWSPSHCGWSESADGMTYVDGEADPVRQDGEFCVVRFRWLRYLLKKNNGAVFRLAIGPDLIAEKKHAAAVQKPAAK